MSFNQLVFPNLFKRFTSKCFCYLLLASIFQQSLLLSVKYRLLFAHSLMNLSEQELR